VKIYAKHVWGKLWDLETGEEILRPIWFDVEAGLFEAYQVNALGRIKRNARGLLTYRARGKIRFDPEQAKPPRPKRTLRRVKEIGHKCEGCTRDAKWMVSDETPLPPVKQGSKLCGRARLTGIRYYCDFCYRGPRIVDSHGEVMQTIEDGGGVRPQWHS
jgi:hypothetical protein